MASLECELCSNRRNYAKVTDQWKECTNEKRPHLFLRDLLATIPTTTTAAAAATTTATTTTEKSFELLFPFSSLAHTYDSWMLFTSQMCYYYRLLNYSTRKFIIGNCKLCIHSVYWLLATACHFAYMDCGGVACIALVSFIVIIIIHYYKAYRVKEKNK